MLLAFLYLNDSLSMLNSCSLTYSVKHTAVRLKWPHEMCRVQLTLIEVS